MRSTTKNKSFITNSSTKVQEDFEEDFGEVQQEMGYFVNVNRFHEFSVPIDSDFGAPSQYRAIVQMLMNATENDTVDFLFNSRGGRMDGLQTILEAVKHTKADTTAIIMGECASAASILALHCNNVHVTDSASMLCHHLSLHVGGKHNDVVAHLEHITRTSLNLMRSAYEGFLTEQELTEMIKGREIYLDSDEIIQHLEARQKYWEGKHKAEQKALEQAQNPQTVTTKGKAAKPK